MLDAHVLATPTPVVPKKKGRGLFQLIKFAVIAFAIVLPVRWLVVQPFIVSGVSMAPTFDANEYLVVDKISYRFQKPQRGDVVILRYPLDSSIFFVKRIVALPGETVNVAHGVVTIISHDGSRHALLEPYASSESVEKQSITTTLASDEYFVLGDNRDMSSDSREWGPLQEKFIIGRAIVSLYPFKDIEFLPGRYRHEGL